MSANRELIESVYDALARGDAAAVLGALDSGIVWMEAENGPYADRNPYFGPQQVAEGVFARIRDEWQDVFMYPDALIEDGDTVVALGRCRGRYRATGVAVNVQFVHVWTVRGGRVKRFQQYVDTAGFRAAMSVVGAPSGAAPPWLLGASSAA